jgi:hypothetical protein
MREISRCVQIIKQAKQMCADCAVRTDANVAGTYDTWQGHMTRSRAVRHVAGVGWQSCGRIGI